jgi:hypothetical protein
VGNGGCCGGRGEGIDVNKDMDDDVKERGDDSSEDDDDDSFPVEIVLMISDSY